MEATLIAWMLPGSSTSELPGDSVAFTRTTVGGLTAAASAMPAARARLSMRGEIPMPSNTIAASATAQSTVRLLPGGRFGISICGGETCSKLVINCSPLLELGVVVEC
jgi:hypothetical protein